MPISVVVQDARGDLPKPEHARQWAEQLGLTYPVLADPEGTFYEVWNPLQVLPVAYVVDSEGVVAWAKAGGAGGLMEIEAQILRLLATSDEP